MKALRGQRTLAPGAGGRGIRDAARRTRRLSCSHGLQSWSMKTLPLSEVKARLSEVAEEVERTHQRVNITRNGRSYVVLISSQDLESLEATLELMSDPDGLARVAQAEADLADGRQTSQTQMAALMNKRRQQERPGV